MNLNLPFPSRCITKWSSAVKNECAWPHQGCWLQKHESSYLCFKVCMQILLCGIMFRNIKKKEVVHLAGFSTPGNIYLNTIHIKQTPGSQCLKWGSVICKRACVKQIHKCTSHTGQGSLLPLCLSFIHSMMPFCSISLFFWVPYGSGLFL